MDGGAGADGLLGPTLRGLGTLDEPRVRQAGRVAEQKLPAALQVLHSLPEGGQALGLLGLREALPAESEVFLLVG